MSTTTKKPRGAGGKGVGFKQVSKTVTDQISLAHIDPPVFSSAVADPTNAQWKARYGVDTKVGDVYYDSNASYAPKVCTVADATTPTWAAIGSGASLTLDGAFDNGKTINGATSSANAMKVGGTNDTVNIFENASNDVQITTSTGANLTIAPAGGTTTVTGDMIVSGTASVGTVAQDALVAASVGSTITDADNAATVAVTNNTITTAALVDLVSTSLTTGKGISLVTNGLTSGSMVYLENSVSGFTGKYIQCYDGSADDFSVGLAGLTTIAGTATGTDALVVTAGDVQVTAGKIDVDDGALTLDTAQDYACNLTRNNATATAAWVTIKDDHASATSAALAVIHDGTGAATAMTIVHAGTADALKITTSDVAGTALNLVCAASTTDSMLKVDGSTGNWVGATGVGMLNLAGDGTLAHANASLLNIAFSGAGAASGMGTCLRIADTGSEATAYAVYISAGTGEAIKVDAGTCVFDEQIEISGGFKTTTGAFVLSDSGAASMDLDGGGANDTFNIGSAVATDVLFHGSGAAGEDCLWDSSASALSFASGAALVLPQGTGSGGSGRQNVTGSLFYETDAKKLWVYDGAGWVGVAVT